MQHLEKATDDTLNKLAQLLRQISDEEYNARPALLNGSGIGQHCRHLLEMFICLNEGYEGGIINYENRRRDTTLEQDATAALNCIEVLLPQLRKAEKRLVLQTGYADEIPEQEKSETSYSRELTYVLEHAVHHMALMAVGLRIVAPALPLPENFGVASSTVKYRKSCAR